MKGMKGVKPKPGAHGHFHERLHLGIRLAYFFYF